MKRRSKASEGFKCVVGKTDCCCRRLLFTQPDFAIQKSHLEEFITAWGHICDYYPKYHCELTFIDQYWGAANLIYRTSPKTTDMKEMEENVKNSLDDVPVVQIRRWASSRTWCPAIFSDLILISYANRAARFISAYGQGLSGSEATWANRKYHGHRTLPPELATKLKMSTKKSIVQQLNDVYLQSIFNPNGQQKLFYFFEGQILPLLALM